MNSKQRKMKKEETEHEHQNPARVVLCFRCLKNFSGKTRLKNG